MKKVQSVLKIVLLFSLLNTLLNAAQTPVSIKLKWKHQFQFAGYYMAKEKGFYKEAGLDVKIIEGDSKNVFYDVENTKVDFGITGSGIVYERLRGNPVVVLGAVFQHSPTHLMVSKDSNITKLSDLIGKRVMLSHDRTQTAELLAMFKKAGINENQITIKESSSNVMSLVNGETDALNIYISNEPYMMKQLGIKYRLFHPEDYGIDFYSDILFTSEKMVLKSPQTVKDFTYASFKGWEYAFEHIDETIAVILKKYNTQNKTAAQLRFEAEELKKLIDAPVVEIGHMSEERWKNIAQHFKELKFLEPDVEINLDGFIYEHEVRIEKNLIKTLVWIIGVFITLILLHSLYKSRENRLTKKLKDEYQQFFDLAPLPYQSLDAEGTVIKVNQAWLDLLGYDKKEVIGKNFAEFIGPKQASLFAEQFSLLKVTGRSDQVECTMLTKEAKEIITVHNSLAVYDKAGNCTQTHCLFKNVTQMRKIQSALQEKHMMLNRAEEVAHIGSWQFIIQKNQLLWSKEMFRIFEEDLNKELSLDLFLSHIHPDDKRRVQDAYNNSLSNRLPCCLTYRALMNDGRIKYIKGKCEVKFDETGTAIVLIGIMQDVTQTKKLEERYQNLLENIGEWVWEIDIQGRYTYVSALVEDILGYSQEELIGKNFLDFMYDNDKDGLIAEDFAKHVKNKSGSKNMLTRQMHKDGSLVIIRSNFQPILNDKDEITGFRGTNVEITREIKMQEELQRKEEMILLQSKNAAMGEMISMIAHQWRQPLNVIGLAVANIQTKQALHILDYKTIEDNTVIIADNVTFMSDTIDDFRNYFKPDSPKELTKVQEVIDTVLNIIGKSLENNEISLTIENNSKSSLFIHKSSLVQVLINIVSNAKDALISSKVIPARINVTVTETQESIVLKICDNAGGIPEDIMDKIIEPYFSTKALTGTGLGLYISRTIVEKHLFGTLNWYNEDKGACFVITLFLQESSNKEVD